MNVAESLALARLLQLASPALPVGAYTYSQGLEWAVEAGWVKDEATALAWIGAVLEHGVGGYEAPLLLALISAWEMGRERELFRLNADFLASRENAEARAETVQMGYSLRRLLGELATPEVLPVAIVIEAWEEPAFPTVWAGLAAAWGISRPQALGAYLWSWAENQAMAALKAVPLGQAAGQRMLEALGRDIPYVALRAQTLEEKDWTNFMPGLAIAGSRHETQYSRIFRS